MLAGTQFLSFGEFVLYKGSGSAYNVNSVEPIEVFYNLRTDLDKLQYAAYITKIVEDVTNENETAFNILQLILNTIYTISETDSNMDLVISVFKLRILSLIGFTPNVKVCTNCGTNENLEYFSVKDNGVKCTACSKQDKSVIHISNATLYAIRYAIMGEPKKLFSFNIPEDALEELKLVSKVYLDEKLEKSYKFEKII